MNKRLFISILFVYAILVVVVFPIVATFTQQSAPKKNAVAIPFGNIMSEYFYFIHTSLTDHNLVAKGLVDSVNITDPELAAFYKNLDWTAKDHLINNYHSHGDSTWHSVSLDRISRPNFLQYWQTIRPEIKAFYMQNLPAANVADPVVHFRCSDCPFIKHVQYHLTKASSVKWMADQIKQKGFDRIILLNCNMHQSNNQSACQEYTNFYASIFADAGIAVDVQCNSILQDFALMVNSPLLVSLNASSFSFMAGISKDPANYITCNMGVEVDGQYALQTEADWILDTREPLLHNNVVSYADVGDVIAKLKE